MISVKIFPDLLSLKLNLTVRLMRLRKVERSLLTVRMVCSSLVLMELILIHQTILRLVRISLFIPLKIKMVILHQQRLRLPLKTSTNNQVSRTSFLLLTRRLLIMRDCKQ